MMDKQINHDSHHDESEMTTLRFSKLPDDGKLFTGRCGGALVGF